MTIQTPRTVALVCALLVCALGAPAPAFAQSKGRSREQAPSKTDQSRDSGRLKDKGRDAPSGGSKSEGRGDGSASKSRKDRR